MTDEWRIAAMAGAILGGVALFIGSFVYFNYLYEKNIKCPHFAENVERPYKYDFFAGGCFVQTTTGQWVHDKNYWNNPVLQ